MADLGIAARGGRGGGGKKGQSKGGQIGKKARAAFDLSGASIEAMGDSGVASTNAAKALMEKKDKQPAKKGEEPAQ